MQVPAGEAAVQPRAQRDAERDNAALKQRVPRIFDHRAGRGAGGAECARHTMGRSAQSGV
jgi:hypothetical protein